MSPQRLDGTEVANLMRDWPGEVCDLARKLREFVLEVAPELSETIAFKALCYYKPDQPYGVIGGNVCMIGPRDDTLHLGFIHGASLPDPGGLLQGTAKAKRHIELRSSKDIRRPAFKKLIRAAVAWLGEQGRRGGRNVETSKRRNVETKRSRDQGGISDASLLNRDP